MPNTVYQWFVEASWRSWYAHALAACAMTYLPVVLYQLVCRLGFRWCGLDPQALAVSTASIALSYYIFKEMGDELKHRRAGEWKKRANIDQVSWASDGKADLVGPFSIWIAALAAWLV